MNEGNFLEVDWSSADIVYLCSVLYPADVMEGIADKCSLLKPGSRLISLKEMPLRPACYRLVAACHSRFSWGLHEVLFYRIMGQDDG